MYLRVLALPTRGVLLKAFCSATILMTYSVPGFRPATTQQIQTENMEHSLFTCKCNVLSVHSQSQALHSPLTVA